MDPIRKDMGRPQTDRCKEENFDRTARWRGLEAEEKLLPIFGAHLALDGRVRMNPLLGTGGNAGRRDFAKGWKNAVDNIEQPPKKLSREILNDDLEAFLTGGACTYLDPFQAGSWFGVANKISNHGNPSAPPKSGRGKKSYRQGEITPWAMALACEGLSYFAGSPSRQLGSREQPKGAFPFVTGAMAPKVDGEAGGVEAEIWLPIWDQPLTEPELRSLFLRGRAEIRDKPAISSAAFAVAIMSRGVDAGVSEFRRFLLLHTTSSKTFESRLATVVPVPKGSPDDSDTRAIRTTVQLMKKLPLDKKVGKRWRFCGLRGPLEQALVDLAATRSSESHVERSWALVDKIIGTLVLVDRNRSYREHNVRFRLLPGEWAAKLFKHTPPNREARLALAISSLVGTPTSPQVIAYRIGVRRRDGEAYWEFPDSVPARRVWSNAGLVDNLGAMAERRVIETLRIMSSRHPFSALIRVDLNDLNAWLSGEVDEERLCLWLDRLCLFEWGDQGNGDFADELQRSFNGARPVIDGALALYALFRPLASDWLFRLVLNEIGIRTEDISTCGHMGRVIAMLRHGDVANAVEVALQAYQAAGVPMANFSFNVFPTAIDPERMLATLIIPVCDKQLLTVFRRWRSPARSNSE